MVRLGASHYRVQCRALAFSVGLGLAVLSCGKGPADDAPVNTARTYPLAGTCSGLTSCPNLTGSAWEPQITGMDPSNHGSATVSTSTITQTGVPITGLGQAAPSTREITVTIPMLSDLGDYGSLTLEASVKNFPGGLYGNAYPILVYLSDGTNEYINLARSGVPGDCASSGYYTCSGGSCSANTGCSITWPSAFNDRDHWEQHQITLPTSESDAFQSYPSVNTFPTCNWSGGNTPADDADPACAFNSNFFTAQGGDATPRLRYGVNYTAKYILLANSYASLSGYTADLEVKVVKKTASSSGGAIDLNVVLVGTKNVQDSRTDKGKKNLNTLFQAVYDYYNQSNTGIKIGSIHAVEWPCDQCGDYYADMELSDLGAMYRNVTPILPAGTEGKAVNLFMVSTIPDSTSGGFTILGVAGAIGGSVLHGTPISGLSFSSFNELATYNTSCTATSGNIGTPCVAPNIDADFKDFGETIAHEMGHYFGLNHPSERNATWHDPVDDTPMCTNKSGGLLTISSCRSASETHTLPSTGKTCNQVCGTYSVTGDQFCEDGSHVPYAECQFNHIMWWTSKNYNTSTGHGDGDLFSSHSSKIINYSSFVQ